MTMTDPIADMLTRIRNGIQVRRKFVDVPSSRIKSSLALILKEEGFLKEVESAETPQGFPLIRVHLKYDQDGNPAIHNIQRVSRPGRRVFTPARNIPEIRRGLGVTVLTTSRGVLTGRKAAELGVGGEILCSVF